MRFRRSVQRGSADLTGIGDINSLFVRHMICICQAKGLGRLRWTLPLPDYKWMNTRHSHVITWEDEGTQRSKDRWSVVGFDEYWDDVA
jgi:hypothetical protein